MMVAMLLLILLLLPPLPGVRLDLCIMKSPAARVARPMMPKAMPTPMPALAPALSSPFPPEFDPQLGVGEDPCVDTMEPLPVTVAVWLAKIQPLTWIAATVVAESNVNVDSCQFCASSRII